MVLGRGCVPYPENFATFSLEMAHFGANSVVYFNRNVKLFTARTTTVICIHVLLAAEGGSIEPVEPPCYAPDFDTNTTSYRLSIVTFALRRTV